MIRVRSGGLRSKLRAQAREAELRTHEALKRAAEVALAAAQARAPGRLPETLSARPLNQYAFRVSSSSPVAVFQENGAKPHVIAPKAGRVLAFQVNGSTVFARSVNHPGNRALHFMRDGAAAGKVELIRLMREILR